MNKTVEKGKTLIIDGPASATLTSGKAEVFGSTMSGTSRIIIREGKRLPFTVDENAEFNVSLGAGATAEEIDGNTIPQSWARAFEELLASSGKPVSALVLGAVDSGKSSFCTYIANRLLREKRKVAVLDGDLGQSDIGPPCTVAYTFIMKPVTDLFNLNTKSAVFIGVTSPSTVINKVVEGLAALKEGMLANNPDFIIVNTDGWIDEEDAVYYKIKLVETLNPDVIFYIQKKDELATILNALEKFRKIAIEYPAAIGQRSMEKRKNLRELGYTKYLRNSKVQSLPLSWLKVEESDVFGLNSGRENPRRAAKIHALLGMKPLHFVELKDKISVIIGKSRWIDAENIKKVEEFTKKKVVIIRKGEEQGILVAVHDAKRKFLGIGILQEIDYLRKTLKVSTPVASEIGIVVMGKVRVDRALKEIPSFSEEHDFSSLRRLF